MLSTKIYILVIKNEFIKWESNELYAGLMADLRKCIYYNRDTQNDK